MLEDTNSLDGAHLVMKKYNKYLNYCFDFQILKPISDNGVGIYMKKCSVQISVVYLRPADISRGR